MITRQQAKAQLKKKGWSYRAAAPLLGITFTHLAYVLTGRRDSKRLLTRIAQLPKRRDAK